MRLLDAIGIMFALLLFFWIILVARAVDVNDDRLDVLEVQLESMSISLEPPFMMDDAHVE